MHFCFRLAAIGLILVFWLSDVPGQSLTDQLLKESPEKLVLQARESGDVVRGAILFHQGNIACAKCHRPNSEQDRIGPDLSRLGKDVSTESLVESILMPPKQIAKEYQSSLVVRADGLTTTGIILDRNDKSVTVRDAQDVTKVITIASDNIDEIVPSTTSIMPNKLADELRNKQQFLDLLRYVIDQKERGPTTNMSLTQAAARALSHEVQGLSLIRKYNCAACHEADANIAEWVKPAAPDLKWTGKNVNFFVLRDHIRNPQAAKPGSTMPKLPLPEYRSLTDPDEVGLLVEFIVSASGRPERSLDFQTSDDPKASIENGRQLFHEVGCVACHAPRNEESIEQPLAGSISLGEIWKKYPQRNLAEFLKNPHQARPSGRMPNLQLTHREATDISAYLRLSRRALSVTGHMPGRNKQLALQGRELFLSHRCSSCHTQIAASLSGLEQKLPASLPRLSQLDPREGCLAQNPPADVPEYSFLDGERQTMAAALEAGFQSPTERQQIDLTLNHFNCTACHSRDQLGGVSPDRRVHFHTTNLNLGEQGRIPPTLTGVGAKLKSKWLRDVLVNGRSIRPYMKTRMPKFGEDNIGHLVPLFEQTDSVLPTEFAEFDDQKKTREYGHRLAGNQGLNCVACHTFQYKLSDTMPAVDLTEMSERLNKDWFYEYMLAPQKFSPNTVMPSFWPGGNAIRPDLEGGPEDQIEALWQYLLDGRQARAPRGIIREPLEMIVTDEARMLRRSYPGIGKRGIGVGYPGNVNLAFDAEQMRLATLWKGRFIDPSGVWYGQGHGRVRPLGQTLTMPAGPDLDSASTPWVIDDGRPPRHQFQGYRLDQKRRPTFLYQFQSVAVEDKFTEVPTDSKGETLLSRTIRFRTSKASEDLRFRVAGGKTIVPKSPSKFTIDDLLQVRIVSAQPAQIVSEESQDDLIVPIRLTPGTVFEVLVEYRW